MYLLKLKATPPPTSLEQDQDLSLASLETRGESRVEYGSSNQHRRLTLFIGAVNNPCEINAGLFRLHVSEAESVITN